MPRKVLVNKLAVTLVAFAIWFQSLSEGSASCGRIIRTFFVDTDTIEGYNKCIEERIQVICGGVCHSEALVAQESSKIVYVPQCKTCQGVDVTFKVFSFNFKIYCDDNNVRNITRTLQLAIPGSCLCKPCLDLPYISDGDLNLL